jgi:hypothetical protein
VAGVEGLYRTTDFGASWASVYDAMYAMPVVGLGVSGANLFQILAEYGLYRSSDLGNTWSQVNVSVQYARILSIFPHGDKVFAGTNGNPGIWVSTDNGENWAPAPGGMTYTGITAFTAFDSMVFAGTGGGVYRSTNDGVTWQPVNADLPASQIEGFALIPSPAGFVTLFTAIGKDVYRSMDSAGWWDLRATLSDSIRSYAVIGTNLFAGTAGGGVYRSSHSGADWVTANGGLTDLHVEDLAVVGQNLFAATGAGLFRSTDLGNTWSAAGLQITGLEALAVDGTRLYATSYGGGISLSDDLGVNWTSSAINAKARYLRAIGVNDEYVFVGSEYGGVWRRPKTEFITSVAALPGEFPHAFSLAQNYPNPFNPTTGVRFQVPGVSEVKLVVYDLLGREVAVLVNERKAPGAYEVRFDGSNLASGVYIYRLTAGSFVHSRTMLLVK